MRCLRCLLKGRVRKILRVFRRRLAAFLYEPVDAIRLEDQVVAVLKKDGVEIRRIVGHKVHNKWKLTGGGLQILRDALYAGTNLSPTYPPCKVVKMRLGSQCSDTSFTYISDTEQDTTNSLPGDGQVKFTASWASSGAIEDICQALIRHYETSGEYVWDAAIYNFGAQFDKPDGVSLEIEWTTTLSS